MTDHPTQNAAISMGRDIVNHLLRLGVTDAVLAPGSRSGPLALALHAADARGLTRLHVRVDEREAAFLALGIAKSSRRIVPVVTTSGTAVANLHPALLEAAHANVGLLAITADRPGCLRGTGANQTTDQRSLFGGISFTETLAEVGRHRYPQHFNVEFDEPLIGPTEWEFVDKALVAAPQVAEFERLEVQAGLRTVVIAGDDAGPVARCAAEAGRWPLLAEPTSGARTGPNVVVAGRLLLTHEPLVSQIEQVISYGHSTLSRPVTHLLARRDIGIVHVGDQSTFPVPAGDNVRFVGGIATRSGERSWLAKWQRADRAAREVIASFDSDAKSLSVARDVQQAVPPGGLLVVGSSSPIRDLDLVAEPAPVGEKRLVIGNRGLAGIDGAVSTAIGAALGRESSRALAFMGDLTFLHGSNGLLIGPNEPRPDLTIVVVNDDGGSIFSTLEQGAPEYADAFERVYATGTGADLAALCRGYQVRYTQVAAADLAAVLQANEPGITVVEVSVDRKERRRWSTEIAAAVRSRLRTLS